MLPPGVGKTGTHLQAVQGELVSVIQTGGLERTRNIKYQVGWFDPINLPDELRQVGENTLRQQVDDNGEGILAEMLLDCRPRIP